MAEPAAKAGPTGGEVAACAKAADQPICLLKIAAHRPHQAYRYDIRLAYSRAVLDAIGDDAVGQKQAGFMDRFASNAESLMFDRVGLANALEADRRGASPAAALALLKVSHLPPGMQSAPPMMAQAFASMEQMARGGAHEGIFKAYAGADALPPAHRPSLGLVKAALADWEKLADQWTDQGRDMSRLSLAAAYQALGDRAAAQRVDARLDGPPGVREGWIALHAGRLEDAASWAIKATLSAKPDLEQYEEVSQLRDTVTKAADAAGRRDLSVKLAEATLAMAMAPRSGADDSGFVDADAAMTVLVRDGGKDAIASWAAKLDGAGHDLGSRQSAKEALAATRGWLAADRPQKARDLALLWALAHEESSFDCKKNPSPDCVRRAGNRLWLQLDASAMMASALTPDEQAKAGFSPITALSYDLKEGRGVTRLSAYLQGAHGQKEMDLLDHCIWRATDLAAIGAGQTCLSMALRFVPPKSYYEVHPVAATDTSSATGLGRQAMLLAAAAAKTGQTRLMHGDLDLGFDLLGRTPGQPFDLDDADKLEDIAIAELREQGRL